MRREGGAVVAPAVREQQTQQRHRAFIGKLHEGIDGDAGTWVVARYDARAGAGAEEETLTSRRLREHAEPLRGLAERRTLLEVLRGVFGCAVSNSPGVVEWRRRAQRRRY